MVKYYASVTSCKMCGKTIPTQEIKDNCIVCPDCKTAYRIDVKKKKKSKRSKK